MKYIATYSANETNPDVVWLFAVLANGLYNVDLKYQSCVKFKQSSLPARYRNALIRTINYLGVKFIPKNDNYACPTTFWEI
jgi:hypothetical protein